METWMTAAGVVLAGTLSPGPNNFVVMRTGARGGWVRALPEMAGVVGGTLVMLLVTVLAGGALFAALPGARRGVALAGALALAWLGGRMLWEARRPPPAADSGAALPSGVRALFVFQFLNPKAWGMVAAVAATASGLGPIAALAQLAPVMAAVSVLSLMVWAALGSLLAPALRRPGVRAGFDATMGVLLLGSAVLLGVAS